jgi:4'-phosphopantetheinyl transferase
MRPSCLQSVPHQLSPDVRIWWVDLDVYAETVALDQADPHEQARATRMTLPEASRRFLAGRHALRQVLGNVLDRPPRSLDIRPDDLGKPHLEPDRAPHFNLSHSGSQALIAVSLRRPVGVDVEVIHRVVDAGPLAAAHFTEAEREEWAHAPDAYSDRTFLACWARKEACVKALGVGLAAPPASVDAGCAEQLRLVNIPVGPDRGEVTVCSLHLPGAAAAVAVATPEAVALARRYFRRPAQPMASM